MATSIASDDRAPPKRPGERDLVLGDPNTINDPMFSWAVRTNFLYFGDVPEWVPLLVHTPNLTVAQLIKKLPPNPADGPPAFSLPDLFAAPLPGLEDSHYFCLHLNWSPAPRLQALSVLTWLEKEFGARYEFCLPTEVQTDAPRRLGAEPAKAPISPAGAARQGPQTFTRSATAPLSAPHAEVAIGVIDDGIAFANQRFRTAAVAQTRIDSVWIQHRHTGGGVISAADIDSAMQSHTDAGIVDESAVYRALGLENFSHSNHKTISRRLAHGTHVMDIAAGYDPAEAPPDRPIIGVQLPGHVVRDTSGALLTFWAYWGIVYILSRTLDASGAKPGSIPVVINLSYDRFDGPHDGTSVFESAVDEIVRMWNQKHGKNRLCVVLPAGNNFLWRSHGKVDLPVGGHQQLSWRVVPDCRTPSVVEIWLPHASSAGPPASVEVNVTAPDGTSSGWMTAGSQYLVASPNGPVATPIWQLSFQNALTAESRPLITLVVAATAAFDPHSADEAVAPSGLWQIDLKNTGAHGVSHIHAWVRRNDTPLGWPVLGRQAYFDDPKYERFDGAGRPVQVDNPASYIHRFGTLNGLATGARTVVVGGCRKSDLAIAEYSSAGPIIYRAPGPSSVSLPRPGVDPDAAAICEDSPARPGVLAAGTRSNTVVAMGGTSVAAPQMARWIADQIANGKESCRLGVDNLATYEEGFRTSHPAPERAGKGRVDDKEPPLPPPHEPR